MFLKVVIVSAGRMGQGTSLHQPETTKENRLDPVIFSLLSFAVQPVGREKGLYCKGIYSNTEKRIDC